MDSEVIIVQNGRHKGKEFHLESDIRELPGGEESLAFLALNGNISAQNAIDIDGYTYHDKPFYYGKIDGLGYIISHKDLYNDDMNT